MASYQNPTDPAHFDTINAGLYMLDGVPYSGGGSTPVGSVVPLLAVRSTQVLNTTTPTSTLPGSLNAIQYVPFVNGSTTPLTVNNFGLQHGFNALGSQFTASDNVNGMNIVPTADGTFQFTMNASVAAGTTAAGGVVLLALRVEDVFVAKSQKRVTARNNAYHELISLCVTTKVKAGQRVVPYLAWGSTNQSLTIEAMVFTCTQLDKISA